MKFGTGQPAARVEDRRFVTGHGRYTDDINLPRQVYAAFLHSPHAHARILSIDTHAAKAASGVLAVYTGQDVAAAGLGNLPCLAAQLIPLKRADGSPLVVPPRPALVKDKVRFVGDYVACAIAETPLQAKDALERIVVDYEDLPVVVRPTDAHAEDAPAVWEDCPDNTAFVQSMGDRSAVDAAFGKAAHVTRVEIPFTRIAMNPMEPRAALGHYDPSEGRYTLYSGTQGPHDLRRFLAQDILHIPEMQLRIVSPDMGGAFGMRGNTFPEMVMVLWASKQLGRPVKWTGERSEAFVADDQGRDSFMTVELALDDAGTFLALRVKSLASLGAYLSLFGPFPTFGNMPTVAGVYRTPAIHVEVRGLYTNTIPIAPYRGAGRPESAMGMEMAIDRAARELGIDRIELRRRNIIPPDAMPFKQGLGLTYDCGEFEKNMDEVLKLADYAEFETRRAAAAKEGKLRGFGLANAIEQSAGMFDEGAEIRFDPSGSATVLVGTHSHGQGHETVFRQLIVQSLGLPFERVRFVQGDTDQVPYGHGTFGSRSSGLAGSAIHLAAEKIVDKGKHIAAHLLETAAADIEFADGTFTVAGTDRRLTLEEVARAAFTPAQLPPGMETGLTGYATFKHDGPTFPNGAHACEVEIDPETGTLEVLSYFVVDDVGRILNPMLLKGQIQGGVVQGLGQILMEQVVWDEDGQTLTGSFMDYCMPRADDVPDIEVRSNEVPTAKNPLGVKGAGEAGTVGGMPCVMSAILDALAPRGIEWIDMPATPERLWRSLNAPEC